MVRTVSRHFGVLLVGLLSTTCSQPVIDSLVSPVAPSSVLTAGLPVQGPNVCTFTSIEGNWVFDVTNKTSGELEHWNTYITEHSDGSASFIDDDQNLVTLTKIGPGLYRAFLETGPECNVDITGTARLLCTELKGVGTGGCPSETSFVHAFRTDPPPQ